MLKCCIVYSLMFVFLSDFLETFEEVKANEQVDPQSHYSIIVSYSLISQELISQELKTDCFDAS